jgi:hypothetical protein
VAASTGIRRMKMISALAPLMCGLILGCASPFHASVDTARYDNMSCVELNEAIGAVATEISQTAITRGKVAQTNSPTWLWGGRRVASTVTANQTRKIEQMRQEEAAIRAARGRRC